MSHYFANNKVFLVPALWFTNKSTSDLKKMQYWQPTAKTVCKEILITRQELSDKNCIKESSDEKNKVMQIFFLLLKKFYREGVIKRKP